MFFTSITKEKFIKNYENIFEPTYQLKQANFFSNEHVIKNGNMKQHVFIKQIIKYKPRKMFFDNKHINLIKHFNPLLK